MADPRGLDIVEQRFGSGDDPIRWRPFEVNDRFNGQWWDQKQYRRTWFAHAFKANEEVARVRLNPDVDVTGFVNVPAGRVPDLEIVFFEVAAGSRGQRIGTSVISALTHRYSHYRLVAAASEDSDGFWAGLSWRHCVHGADPRFRPAMFFG